MDLSAETVLDLLLAADQSSAVKRNVGRYDKIAGACGNSIVVFGANFIGRIVLKGLRTLGLEPLAFADNNTGLWGTDLDGVRVKSVEDCVREYKDSAVFVIAIYNHEVVVPQLNQLRFERFVPYTYLFYKYHQTFLPCYAFDLPAKVFEQQDGVRQGLGLWADEASRLEYIAQIGWHVQMADWPQPPRHHLKDIYFESDLFTLRPDELLVDCGAFDGDTIRSFIGRQSQFEKIISFEPDPKNRARLNEFVAQLPSEVRNRIEVVPCAVGASRGSLTFDAAGTTASSISDRGDVRVDLVPLDEVLAELTPTIIKMDVEGAELEALAGASHAIQRSLPVLSISVYHKQDDLWKIPLYIRSLSEDYRFYLRRYLGEFWDVICYAIPSRRCQLK